MTAASPDPREPDPSPSPEQAGMDSPLDHLEHLYFASFNRGPHALERAGTLWPSEYGKEFSAFSDLVQRLSPLQEPCVQALHRLCEAFENGTRQACMVRARNISALLPLLHSTRSLRWIVECCAEESLTAGNTAAHLIKIARTGAPSINSGTYLPYGKAVGCLIERCYNWKLSQSEGTDLVRELGSVQTETGLRAFYLATSRANDALTPLEFAAWIKTWETRPPSLHAPALALCKEVFRSHYADEFSDVLRTVAERDLAALFLRVIDLSHTRSRGLKTIVPDLISSEALDHRLHAWEGLLRRKQFDVFHTQHPERSVQALETITTILSGHQPPASGDRFLEQLARFMTRSFPPHAARNISETLQILARRENLTKIFSNPQAFEKLLVVLSGRGLPDQHAVSGFASLNTFLQQLRANVDMLAYINEVIPEKRQQKLREYVRVYEGDNPPFGIASRETPTPKHVQIQFQSEISSVLLGLQDSYFGAWANTYTFRHTPESRRCLFDEMVTACGGRLFVLPVADFNRFPGSGRIVTSLSPASFFKPDPYNSDDPFHKWKDQAFPSYGPVRGFTDIPSNVHALDNFQYAQFTPMRAGFAVSVPENQFMNLAGENMTYIDWNHHFDATGVVMASLVPTRAFNEIIQLNQLFPYNPADSDIRESRGWAKDGADFPPVLDNIRRVAASMGCSVGVVNLSAGSNVSGGLCDGFDFGSKPYREWERSVPDYWTDGFGLKHKYHIKDETGLTSELWAAHRRIYEIATALQRVRDMYRYAFGRDARGDSQREQPTTGDHLLEEVSYYYEGRNIQRLRMLQFFCEFTSEYQKKGAPPEVRPNLVLAPMVQWSAPVSGPFVLDGYTGVAFQNHEWGDPVLFDIDGPLPGPRLIDWWHSHVDPYLDQNPWVAPRLVARENCLSLMKQFGYNQTTS